MAEMKDGFIDLTVTSPPYDNIRSYKGSLEWGEHIWMPVLEQLYRITKKGGVVVWIVGDATIKGSETGTSFRQALYAMEIGFNLHDTMIWDKGTNASIGAMTRYADKFEYMFVFSKGTPTTANIIKDRKNLYAGELQHGSIRQKDGAVRKTAGYGKRQIAEFGRRYNIWQIHPVKAKKDRVHPAPFPSELAHYHIITWSSEGGTVFDPFMGSGTTGKMAKENNRDFIGIEKVKDYFNIAQGRINAT